MDNIMRQPVGIGIDIVSVSSIRQMMRQLGRPFLERTFSERERQEATCEPDPCTYYAGRFAVKEAVFKAVAGLTEGKTFDFRVIETLRESDGHPEVQMNDALRAILQSAHVDRVMISISHESDFSIAIAQALK